MKKLALLITFGLLPSALRAELKLPAIFGDHMVLQQKLADPIWGWDTPGAKISVSFAGKDYAATADAAGQWKLKLDALPASNTAQTLTVTGSTRREIQDVLVGEVWMCSGQSNMRFALAGDWNGSLEAAASKLPNLRLIQVPNVGTQELQKDFQGQWQAATPATALKFSAVGFLYGRYLHEILDVPVGLIDNSWGGSAAEAWVRRSSLENDPRFQDLIAAAEKREAKLLPDQGKADYAQAMADWRSARDQARAEKKLPPTAPLPWLVSAGRPGNIFAGVLAPTLGYGIKGVIWYQGETNYKRASEYASLFPFLIEQWRKEWGQGDFPFYWVQLPNYAPPETNPGDHDWADLRGAQTLAMTLPHTGQAVTIDLGEGDNIHPKDKHDVAARLVRWPLACDYGRKLPYRSPEFSQVTFDQNRALVSLDCFGGSLRLFGVTNALGFTLCGADKVWHPATGALIETNEVEVSSPEVPLPVAVRYAWTDNPVCNLFSSDGLPVTPFRTDAPPF